MWKVLRLGNDDPDKRVDDLVCTRSSNSAGARRDAGGVRTAACRRSRPKLSWLRRAPVEQAHRFVPHSFTSGAPSHDGHHYHVVVMGCEWRMGHGHPARKWLPTGLRGWDIHERPSVGRPHQPGGWVLSNRHGHSHKWWLVASVRRPTGHGVGIGLTVRQTCQFTRCPARWPGGGPAHCAERRGLSVEVMDGNESGRHKGPAHARKRALPRENEERLAEIGRQLPPPKEEELEIIAGLRASRRRRRLLTWGTALIIAALCAGAIAQWVRPLPHATFQTREVRLPGMAPSFAWPSSGEAAATVVGVGTVGQVRGSQSVPVAGLAELLAAYVVLSDHRLAPGGDGPAIPVTADALAAYQVGQARQESEVPVAAGESLTELQALEGLLVDSGADMATVLADWDAGSVSAFVAKMNAAASMLGLTRHISPIRAAWTRPRRARQRTSSAWARHRCRSRSSDKSSRWPRRACQ